MRQIKSRFPIIGFVESLQGGRSENQDYCADGDTPMGLIVLVCDGMGGGPSGRTASTTVVKSIAKSLAAEHKGTDRKEVLQQAIDKAQQELEQIIEEQPELTGMGTTLTAMILDKYSAVVAHIGDSRIYQLRGNRVVFRTQDHSFVGELVRKGVLTEEQARHHDNSSVITRCLGPKEANHTPEFHELLYAQGDRIILCSDGIWGSMPEKELIARFSAQDSIDTLVSSLCEEIDQRGKEQGGGHDNMTISMISVGEDSAMYQNLSWFKKSGMYDALTEIGSKIIKKR